MFFPLEEDSEREDEEEHFDSEGLEAALLQLQEIATSPVLRQDSLSPEVLDHVTRNRALNATTAHDATKLASVAALAASLASTLAAAQLTGALVVVREAHGVSDAALKRGGAVAVSAIFAAPRNAFVVVDEGPDVPKLIIDPGFRDAFRVRPATRTYSALVDSLPEVFMGTEQQLRQIVRLLATEIARSYTSLGLVPAPWRRHSALLARWLPTSFTDHPVTPAPPKAPASLTPASPNSPFIFGSVTGATDDDGEEVVWRPTLPQPQLAEREQQPYIVRGHGAPRTAMQTQLAPQKIVHGFHVMAA